MTAIIASTVGVKTMADDTLRLTIDIDPRYAGEAFALFGKRGSACAIARLTNESAVEEMRSQDHIEEPLEMVEKKGGELAKLAGILCNSPDFINWLGCDTADEARRQICSDCDIDSRRELDHNEQAAKMFHLHYREPFVAYMKKRGVAA